MVSNQIAEVTMVVGAILMEAEEILAPIEAEIILEIEAVIMEMKGADLTEDEVEKMVIEVKDMEVRIGEDLEVIEPVVEDIKEEEVVGAEVKEVE